MNIFDIEQRRGEALQDLVYCSTARQKLFVIRDFFTLLLEYNNPALFEAYSIEFLEIYLSALSAYSPMYLQPFVTEELLVQINQLLNLKSLSSVHDELGKYSTEISDKLHLLKQYLSGTSGTSEPSKLCFPILEIQEHTHTKIRAGLLETVTIKISKGRRQDKFLIVPLTGNPEEKLSEQIKVSWDLALQYVKQHIRRVDKFHEVIIHFDGRLGNYIGYSLGLMLTIGFIEELLNYYNAPYLVKIKNSISLTGGIDQDGHLLPVGNAIEDKVETVFFSGTVIFILPGKDKITADSRLLKLKAEYPGRVVNLVGVDCLQDVLNRRDLIDIRRQNTVVRIFKRIKENSLVVLLALLLLSLSSYYTLRDYDDNPAIFTKEGFTALIKNASGKILWKINTGSNTDPSMNDRLEYVYRILDVNNDSENEVLICEGELAREKNHIVCYDKKGKLLWKYTFRDTVYSRSQGYIKSFYGSPVIIGVDTIFNRYILYLCASNLDSYPAVIFRLDAQSGKRLPGALWNDGHINSGKLFKFNGNIKLVFACYNNSFERVAICKAGFPDSNALCPHKQERGLIGVKPAMIDAYILFPNTDYNKFYNLRTTNLHPYSLEYDTNVHSFGLSTIENPFLHSTGIGYKVNEDFRSVDVTIHSSFRSKRDSLVSTGFLSQPFTDTPEYCELLKSSILYWNGTCFKNRL